MTWAPEATLLKCLAAAALAAAYLLGLNLFYQHDMFHVIKPLVRVGQWLGLSGAAVRAFAFTMTAVSEALLAAFAIGVPLCVVGGRYVMRYWLVFVACCIAMLVAAIQSKPGSLLRVSDAWSSLPLWLDMLAIAGLALPLSRRLSEFRDLSPPVP
jgi:hypothetical protein